MEDLQNEVLLLGAADTQQVGSACAAKQVGLQPGQLLLRLGVLKHLHKGNKGVKKETKVQTSKTHSRVLNGHGQT